MDRDRTAQEREDERLRDAERLAADRAAKESGTEGDRQQADETEPTDESEQHPNPPRTTTGRITSPKFGSAGSGGAELDPGYDKN